jgi:transposase
VIQASFCGEFWMNTERFVIADEVWEKVSPHVPGKATDCGVTAADNRLFLEAVLWRVRTGSPWRDLPVGLGNWNRAVLWRVRTGSPWRDLPVAFGNWNSVFQRFRRWAEKDVFKRLFEVLSEEPDFEYALIDGTIVSVHQNQAIGRSRGGLTTKIVALVDALGGPDPFRAASRSTP